MDDVEFDEAWEHLCGWIDDAVELLRDVGETMLAAHLAERRARLATDGANALDSLLAVFDGLDTVPLPWLHPESGHRIADTDVRDVNDRLMALRTAISRSALELRHAVRRHGRR